MQTQEEKLNQLYTTFGDNIKKIAEDTIGNMVTEFIPYAKDDLESNLYTYSRSLIESFLTDTPTYEWETVEDIFDRLNSEDVRKKMLKDYRDEIINQIIEDQEKEINRLNERIKWLDNLNESYRRF
jgi:predicted ribosome quality control (RQC) complex YloA/Tae2 family protein